MREYDRLVRAVGDHCHKWMQLVERKLPRLVKRAEQARGEITRIHRHSSKRNSRRSPKHGEAVGSSGVQHATTDDDSGRSSVGSEIGESVSVAHRDSELASVHMGRVRADKTSKSRREGIRERYHRRSRKSSRLHDEELQSTPHRSTSVCDGAESGELESNTDSGGGQMIVFR